MKTLWLGLALAAMAFSPAHAFFEENTELERLQEKDLANMSLTEEIIYRTNLGRADDVTLLINRGASPDLTDGNGVPLIALASGRKDNEGINVVKALLNAGADLSAKDRNGRSALFYAAKSGNQEIVEYLLSQNINYYATDNRGDIARTIAHREGYNNVVEAMDTFVLGETKKVNQQYEDLNRTLEERYKNIQQQENESLEEFKKREAALVEQLKKQQEQPSSVRAPAATSSSPASNEKVEEKLSTQEILDKRESPEFRERMSDMSYQVCAFQYWSFCREAQQTTDLSNDELNDTIEKHRQKIIELQDDNKEEYYLTDKYLNRIIDFTKKRIFYQLNEMPSKTYRFERGVCKTPDMKTRCNDAAAVWDQQPPKPAKKSRGRGRDDGRNESRFNKPDGGFFQRPSGRRN